MATQTYQARLIADLALLVSAKKLANWSNLDDIKDESGDPRAENTARTAAVVRQAAAYVEGRLGAAGNYDDGDATVGNQRMVDFGVRYALLLYSQVLPVTLTDAGRAYIGDIKVEIEAEREALIQEASTPYWA